jgi:phospholipid N-methyltransferase
MPVYNERAFVRRSIERVFHAPLPYHFELEIVVVDDCSTDGTSDVLQQIALEYPNAIRLFRQTENQGKGAAIRRAVSEMQGDIAIIQDADLEYDPDDYARMLAPIIEGQADVVYGSRFAGSPRRRVLNYHHALGNMFLTHLSNLFTGLNLTDMETCYKAFRADLLRTIPIRSNRFGLEPEITAKVARRHCTVYEVPISYFGRTYAEGKKINWKDGLQAIYVIIKFFLIDDCFHTPIGHSFSRELSSTRQFSEWIVNVIEPYLGNRILEIGAGIGNISRQLPKREFLTISDYDDEYITLLNQAFRHYDYIQIVKLDISNDDGFEALAAQHSSVVCLNVLERVEDDVAALRRMNSLLQPGGRLIIMVPQHRWLMSNMDKKLGRYLRYTAPELTDKIELAGLNVTKVFNFNKLGILGWLINNRLRGRTTFGRFQLKIFDSLVPIMSRIERWLPLPGLSLILIATKRN